MPIIIVTNPSSQATRLTSVVYGKHRVKGLDETDEPQHFRCATDAAADWFERAVRNLLPQAAVQRLNNDETATQADSADAAETSQATSETATQADSADTAETAKKASSKPGTAKAAQKPATKEA